MKIKLFTILFILAAFVGQEGYSQLANSNMYVLKNDNRHAGASPTGTYYSALWGYKAPNGREYAILGCDSGTAFIDVTDSANIREVDFVPGLISDWREMKTYSHYAYIVSEATNSRLQIVDLQYLPDSVRLVTTWSYTGYTKTHSIQQSGPYLYLHGGNVTQGGTDPGGLTIVDVTNPIAPVKRGSWSDYYVHDSRVIDDTIYACNIYDPPGRISVINAVNKDNPTNVSYWTNNPNPFPHNAALTTNKRYVFTTDETSSPNGKLKIWDRQNIQNVTFVGTWLPTGITNAIVHNVEIYGNYAVVAHYAAGVRVLNITNPTAPVEAAWYDTYTTNNSNNFNGCWGVYMLPSGKIIASDRQKGLFVLKTTFPMVVTGVQNVNGEIPTSFKLEQNYPNPFNPTTSISFAIPKNAQVLLEVFDITGKNAATLVNDKRDAGNYDIKFDAAKYGLTSGIYFYKVTASSLEGTFSETKKMMLVK